MSNCQRRSSPLQRPSMNVSRAIDDVGITCTATFFPCHPAIKCVMTSWMNFHLARELTPPAAGVAHFGNCFENGDIQQSRFFCCKKKRKKIFAVRLLVFAQNYSPRFIHRVLCASRNVALRPCNLAFLLWKINGSQLRE